MKVVILAGGKGSRISYYTEKIPKPMIKIGGLPMLTHIMRHFKYYGFNEFIIAAGYKKSVIDKYYKNSKEFKNLKIINTGISTQTGGRILKLKKILNNDENFFMTYGDGVCNINLKKLLNFHLKNKKIATVTAVRPPVKFGEMKIGKNKIVNSFMEKPKLNSGWINGGFFVFNKKIFNFIPKKDSMLEREMMKNLTKKKELVAFKHNGFWQCMDTMRDKIFLNNLVKKDLAPWKK